MLALQKKGIGKNISLFLVITLVIVVGLVLAMLIGNSVDDFSNNLPAYQERIAQQWHASIQWLALQGVVLPSDYLNDNLDPKAAMRIEQDILRIFYEFS